MIVIEKPIKKLLIILSIICLWLFLLFSLNFFMSTQPVCLLSLEENFDFAYLNDFAITSVFANENIEPESVNIVTNHMQKPPIYALQDYTTIQNNLQFKYPTSFILEAKDLGGSEILYHIDFKDNNKIAHGFIQVWNMPKPLKDFLEQSKSTSNMEFTSFTQKEITINKVSGYLWDYVFLSNEQVPYKGMEVFLSKNEKMYRLSYFLPQKDWNNKQQDIFWNMANSLKIK